MINEVFKQDRIQLVEPGHKYVVKGYEHLRFSSITTFIKDFFEGFNANETAEKLAGKGKYANTTKEELLADWEQSGIDGTTVHNEIENFILAGYPHKDIPLNDIEVKTKHALLWLEQVIEPHFELFPEVKLFNSVYQLAGTVDLLIHNMETDQWIMVDWKTNKKIHQYGFGGKTGRKNSTRMLPDCNYMHYTLQMSMYQYMLQEDYNIKIEDRILLHLKPKTTAKFPLGVKEYWTEYLKANVERMLWKRIEDKEAGELFSI